MSDFRNKIPEAKRLPDAEKLTIDRDHYYGQTLCGYYQFDCVVTEKKTRSAKFYIPEGSIFNQPTVFVMVPENYETWSFLVESGWKEMADKEKLYMVLMEPEQEAWGAPEEEIAYINALNEDISFRPFFCAFSSNFYGVAYGEAAELLAKQARWNPKAWGGIALLGACGLDEEEKRTLESTETKVPGVMFSQVQMPVWISVPEKNEASDRLEAYYRKANHQGETGGTMDEHWCAKTVYEEADWKNCMNACCAKKIFDQIWRGVYRYPGNCNGALRCYGDIRDRGFQKFSANVAGGYCSDGSDYYHREWWVYVPKSVDQTKPYPAVFVFHGAGGSADEIADRSGWADAADRHGFMILCPGASRKNSVRRVSNMVTNELFRSFWNTGEAEPERPADILFLDYLYAWVTEHYPVDKSRIYASGQSSGGMMTWTSACSRPDYFAAAAPVSAKVRSIDGDRPCDFSASSQMPVMCCMGLEDRAFPGGFATEDARELVDRWQRDFGLEESWDSYTYNDGGKHCSWQEGLFTNYLYQRPDGVPLLRCVEVTTKAHAIWPSECGRIWRAWFEEVS